MLRRPGWRPEHGGDAYDVGSSRARANRNRKKGLELTETLLTRAACCAPPRVRGKGFGAEKNKVECPNHSIAYVRVYCRAWSSAPALSFFHCAAALLFRGSSGSGALSKAWILNSTVRICSAGLHLSLRISRQIRPMRSMFGCHTRVRKRTSVRGLELGVSLFGSLAGGEGEGEGDKASAKASADHVELPPFAPITPPLAPLPEVGAADRPPPPPH